MRRFAGLIFFLWLPSVLAAQTPAEHRSLAHWQDSLLLATSPAALRSLSTSAGRQPEVDGLRWLLFLERRGELSGSRQDLELAITNAMLTLRQHPAWAWPHYALARAYLTMERAGWRPIVSQDDIQDYEAFGDKMWQHLRAAVARDPALAETVRPWALPLLVASGDRLLRDDELAVLATELDRADPDPDALLVWARHLRTLRKYDSALVIFTQSAALGGDPSRLWLERARTLRALHDSVGASAAYWNGVKELTATGREMYRYDLAFITSKDSLAAFDKVPDAGMERWLKRFWDERDAAAANHFGDRLNEHLRRWVVSYARYRVRSPWRRIPFTNIDVFFDNTECVHLDEALYDLLWKMPPVHPGDLREHEWLLDHRGIMYLRHGEPLRRLGARGYSPNREDFISGPPAAVVDTSSIWSSWLADYYGGGWSNRPMKGSFPAKPVSPNGPVMDASIRAQTMPRFTESWLYTMDGEQRVIHFRDSYSIGMYDATTLASFLPYNPMAWLRLTGTVPEYQAAADRIIEEIRNPHRGDPPTCWNEIRAGIARSRVDAEAAVGQDTDSPPYARNWNSVVQVFGIGAPRNTDGLALLVFAFGGQSVQPDSLPDGRWSYRVNFHISGWERSTGRTISLDTTRRFARQAPMLATEVLNSWIEVPLPPGNWELAVRATQDAVTGAFAVRRNVPIAGGSTFDLSDIVTGVAGGISWRPPDGSSFALNALGAWPAGSNAEIYFEVYGLVAEQSFTTTIDVHPVESSNKQSVKIASPDRATGPVTAVRRSLGLERLPAGRYVLALTVDIGSSKVSRSQQIVISAPK